MKTKNRCADCEHNGAWGTPMKCEGCLPGYKNYELHKKEGKKED